MAITRDVTTNEQNKFVESTAVPGQPVLPVANADGTPLSISISASDIQIGAVEIKDATGSQRANVRDLTNSDALNVAIVDGSGDQITSFGGGAQYTEGDADATVTGTAVMWEDTSDTLRAVSEAKPLPVNIVAGSSSGTQYTEDDAAAANPIGTALNLIRKDTLAALTTTDGDNVAARGTDKGELYVKHVDAIPVTDNGGALTVDGTVAVTNAGITTIAGAVSGTEMQVDVVGSLPAGTNNIGDVDIASSALPTGAATAANQSTLIGHVDGIESLLTTIDADTSNLSVVGTGTEATAMRVTIASDSTGLLSVDDNGGSLTVDNAGLTELAAAINASSQVDVNIAASGATVPVSNAGLTELAAAINSNKVDVNIVSSDVATGGTSAADDADFTAGTTPATPAMGVYESTPTSVTDGDLGTVGITSGRRLKTSATIDAALPAGTNNIGDVDVLSSALPTGASTSAKQDTVIGHLDGVETLLTTIDTDTSNISTKIDTVAGAVSGTEMQVDVLTMPTVAVSQSGTWDEVGINDSGNSITVDNAQLSVVGSGTEAAAMRVTIATDSTGVLSIDDNGGAITVDGTVAVTGVSTLAEQQSQTTHLATIAGDTTSIQTAVEILDNAISGSEMQVDVVAALPAGTNAIGKLAANSGVDIGDVDVTSISAGTNTIGNVGLVGRTTGGLTIFRSIDLDESEEEVKATAGQVFTIVAFNRTAAPVYLKFYNATAANVTVGTTTPVMTFVVPANADSDGAGFTHSTDIGYSFGTAITVAATTGIADNDTGTPGANDCIVNIGYV